MEDGCLNVDCCMGDTCEVCYHETYRLLENGEQMQSGDEFSPNRTTDPNDPSGEWKPIPVRSVGKIYYYFEFKATRRKR